MGSSWLSFSFFFSQTEWDNISNTHEQNAVCCNTAIALSLLTEVKYVAFQNVPLLWLAMLSYIVHLTFLESAVPLCALSLLKLFHYQLYVSAKTLSDTTDVLLRAYAGSILSINIIIIINTFFFFYFYVQINKFQKQHTSLNKLTTKTLTSMSCGAV